MEGQIVRFTNFFGFLCIVNNRGNKLVLWSRKLKSGTDEGRSLTTQSSAITILNKVDILSSEMGL